jgi:hypothetical protein
VTRRSGIESKPPVSNLISLEEDSLTYTTFVMLLCLDFPDQGKFNDAAVGLSDPQFAEKEMDEPNTNPFLSTTYVD